MRRRIWVGFAALCLLLGSEWILDQAAPRSFTGLWGIALRSFAFTGLFALFAFRRKQRTWPRLSLIAWGAALFVSLPLAFAGAGGKVSGLTEFLVFSFIPATVVVAESQRDSGFGVQPATFGLLGPALAGLGGAALLIAYTLPSSVAGRVWLAAMILAAGLTGLALSRIHRALQGLPVLSAAVSVAGGATIAAAAFCWLGWVPPGHPDVKMLVIEFGRTFALDAPLLLLLVWLLREMRPVSLAARYLLVPLIAVAESALIARPTVDWTMILGTLLILGASWRLLRPDS